tara:strand:+ start:1650 stop:1853 length:204 start_codon:yes stop_codon:yes gene_type:complete
MGKDELVESDENRDVYKTPFGFLTVFKKDQVGMGKGKGKAGTSVLEPFEGQPVAREIKLRKKYRHQA